VVGRVEAAGAALGRCYASEAAKLRCVVGDAHSALRHELAHAQQLEQLRAQKEEAESRAAQLQRHHEKELEELRTYFERHCEQINQK